VSRLFGHSSSSGAQRVRDESDCVIDFERRLLRENVLTKDLVAKVWQDAKDEADAAVEKAMSEPQPKSDDVPTHTYAPSPVDCIYRYDYTGLPGRRHDLGYEEIEN
jgi:2-oxoisovalerate dehydrogenase E1 component alpha subunit